MEGSILVVDNDRSIRELLSGNLRHAGYRVSCASNVPEAEALVRVTRPDVALLDWTPGNSGLTFARQLRGDQRTAEMSIIMLSERGNEQDSVAALEIGADDYVTKPFSMRELLARVKAVLRRRTPQLADDVIDISGLRFDPAALRVSANGEDVELRQTEFRMLHFFMTHPHRTFSRRTLLDEVWGDHIFVEERTVDVHIRRLRRALAPSGHNELVETVRGVGYRFNTDTSPAPAPMLHSAIAGLMRVRQVRGPQLPQVNAA
jgi:two-component system phosphate regulon response regulator PhoB